MGKHGQILEGHRVRWSEGEDCGGTYKPCKSDLGALPRDQHLSKFGSWDANQTSRMHRSKWLQHQILTKITSMNFHPVRNVPGPNTAIMSVLFFVLTEEHV